MSCMAASHLAMLAKSCECWSVATHCVLVQVKSDKRWTGLPPCSSQRGSKCSAIKVLVNVVPITHAGATRIKDVLSWWSFLWNAGRKEWLDRNFSYRPAMIGEIYTGRKIGLASALGLVKMWYSSGTWLLDGGCETSETNIIWSKDETDCKQSRKVR